MTGERYEYSLSKWFLGSQWGFGLVQAELERRD